MPDLTKKEEHEMPAKQTGSLKERERPPKTDDKSKKEKILLLLFGGISGCINGFFGGGGGVAALFAFQKGFKLETKASHAMCVCAMLPVTVLSTVLYGIKGMLPQWETVLLTAAGTVLGGYLGAKLLTKLRTVWVVRLFTVFLTVSSVYMIIG